MSGESGGNGGGGAISADGAVNVDNWSFYARPKTQGPPRSTPYLVGPIVGTVTETTARILVEMERTQEVTMEAFMDGSKVYAHTAEVRARTPTVFKLNNFAEGKRIRVTVNIDKFGQEREARFTTLTNKTKWKIAAVSCNNHTRMESLGLWERLARVAGEVDCVLHLGDQVYADTDVASRNDPSIKFDSAWTACLGLINDIPQEQWAAQRGDMLEHYRKTYRMTWNLPALAKVLASTANYMICDDHEVVDDLGDEKEHLDQSSAQFFVIKVAYQVYCEYQRQLLCDTDVTDSETKPYYSFRLSPKIGFFMTDNRVERSMHRGDGAEEEWKDHMFLGPRQWARLREALSGEFKDCDTILFGAPTPLVFLSQAATGIAEKVIDDARGTWGHENFRAEQTEMCHTLSRWQNERPNRAIVTLAGDVHIGGFTDSWHEGHTAPLHQMTASAIGNMPEGNIDSFKATLARHVQHADEHLFKFKVKHHDWIYGPNFGMIDATVGKGNERPDISLTLVPHKGSPKIRNLTFGNSNISVSSASAHGAAAVAHATAKILEMAPQGMAPTPGSGGCCTACTIA